MFDDDTKDFTDTQEVKVAKNAIKAFDQAPQSFEDCIKKARNKF